MMRLKKVVDDSRESSSESDSDESLHDENHVNDTSMTMYRCSSLIDYETGESCADGSEINSDEGSHHDDDHVHTATGDVALNLELRLASMRLDV